MDSVVPTNQKAGTVSRDEWDELTDHLIELAKASPKLRGILVKALVNPAYYLEERKIEMRRLLAALKVADVAGTTVHWKRGDESALDRWRDIWNLLLAVSMAYFRYSAIQLALSRQDPSLPYLGAVITSALEERQDPSIRILVLLCLCLAVGTILFYSVHVVRLLSGLGAAKGTARMWMAYIASFWANGFALIYYFNPAMWLLIIRLGGSHGQTQ